MRDRHRAIIAQQQLGHRFAHDIRSTDDDRFQPGKVAEVIAQQHLTAKRRARHQPRTTCRQQPGIDDVEAVDVLRRINCRQNALGADMGGQGELHQDAVNCRITVQGIDERQ